MKKVTKEVKSKGKTVDTIQVPQYESLKEAASVLTDKKVLDMINKVVCDTACNNARTAKVRPTSPMAQLGRLAKDDPKAKSEIDALLKKYHQGA